LWRAQEVRALLWPLFASSSWAKPETVVAGTRVEGAALSSVLSVGRVEPAFFVAGMTGEGSAMACVLSVGVCSASDFGGGNEK
jgi:hypothetical protein